MPNLKEPSSLSVGDPSSPTHSDLKWASYDAAFEDPVGSDLGVPELTSDPVQAQIDAGHRQLDAGDQDGA